MMKKGYRLLGEFIRQVDVRNTEGKEENLLGVSVQKQFIPSIANTVGTDFTKYKVVRKGQFTYIPDTSRRGDKIGIALLEDYDEGLVSNVYTVFEVIDENQLIPEYLMLWFSRPEFDRYARFKSHGSVREVMEWDEMCKVELPVPSIEKQKSIVKAYKAITHRIALKKRINDNLEATAMTIYKSWFIDFEPFQLDDAGLPVGWKATTLDEKLDTSTQSINPQNIYEDYVWHYSIPAYDNEKLPAKDVPSSILSNKYVVPQNAILVSKLNPETKRVWRTLSCFEDAICSTEFIVFTPKVPSHNAFYYLMFNTQHFIDFLVSNATGSTNSRMRVKPTSSLDYEFLCPNDSVISDFCTNVEPLLTEIEKNTIEIRKLRELIPIAVAKMMTSSH